MNCVWKDYSNKAKNTNSFSPFSLQDNYTSSSVECSSGIAIQKFDDASYIEGMVFLAETLKTEVITGTKKKQKKNLKQLKRLFFQFTKIALTIGTASLLGTYTLSPNSVAASTILKMTTPTTPEITPSMIIDWGFQIALLVMATGFALAAIMFGIVGIYQMVMRKKDVVIEWNSDIVKGLIQVLVSIPLVYALYLLAQFVFKRLPIFEGIL